MAPPLKGLSDVLTMCGQKVDTLVKSHTRIDGLHLLQFATGKRYMNRYAAIEMGPPSARSFGPVKDARSRLRIYNEHQRNLEWLLMQRAGKTNRKNVYQDLQSADTFNALRSLAYGKNGLVDAVVVGEDKLLTRPTLDKFYQARGLAGKENEKSRENFNKLYQSMNDVIVWAEKEGLLETFNHFSPNSISQKPTPLQKSVLDKDDKDDPKADVKNALSQKVEGNQEKMTALIRQLHELIEPKKEDKKKTETKFHFHKEELDKKGKLDLDRHLTLSKEGQSGVVEVQHVPAALKGNTFVRDSLIFPAEFSFDTLHPLESALDRIYEKKGKLLAQGKPVANALIVENTPGGAVIVTEQLKNKIESASVPTDVIIQGWGSSGGSKLVSMATGNRFATPNSSVLLHETRGGHKGSLNDTNKAFRSMEYSGSGYKHLIAKRSGRSLQEVQKDFKLDFEVNAIESILYGPHGLIDAILVESNKILTRDTIMDFIIEKKGSPKAAQEYIDQKFVQRREGAYTADIDDHKPMNEDPLANPLEVIHELVNRGKAVPMDSVERFKASISDVAGEAERTMHLYKVSKKPDTSVKKK
jgi:ATP-dependent Clp protease protease subunit